MSALSERPPNCDARPSYVERSMPEMQSAPNRPRGAKSHSQPHQLGFEASRRDQESMDREFVFFAALPIAPHGSCPDRRQMPTSTGLDKGKPMSTADPNVVIVTGENPFIRLSVTDSDDYTTNASFWRIIFSPAGPGHVLYLKSEL